MNKLFLLWMLGVVSLEAKYLVIASGKNSALPPLGLEEVHDLYIAKHFRIGNQKVLLLNLEADHPLRHTFEHEVLRENREHLEYAWLQAHYLGHHAPKVFKSQEAIAEFLVNVEDAVGYVDEEVALQYHLTILFRVKE